METNKKKHSILKGGSIIFVGGIIIMSLMGGFYLFLFQPLHDFFRSIEDVAEVSGQPSTGHEQPAGHKQPMYPLKTASIKKNENLPVKEVETQKSPLINNDRLQENRNNREVASLTDMAPEPPHVGVLDEEHPIKRLEQMGLPEAPQYSLQRKMSEKIPNSSNPPQWTETIASPSDTKERPDPFTPPPIKVDPRRRP